MQNAYLEFTEFFQKLSPYELNHLTEVLLCKIEDCFEGKLSNASQKELASAFLHRTSSRLLCQGWNALVGCF